MKKEVSNLTEHEKTRLKIAERNIKVLEQRLIRAEEELALCLKWMRVQAELEAKKKDPNFVVHEDAQA